MTAEIAIMNRGAVALAADSVVTVDAGDAGRKTYNTVNKLFALSRQDAVGIMVYGNGTFMRVPWEVIINIYRQQLRAEGFATLPEYVEDFFSFVRENKALFPDDLRREMFQSLCFSIFSGVLKEAVKDSVSEIVEASGAVRAQDIRKIIDRCLVEQTEGFRNYPDLEPLDEKAMDAAFDDRRDVVLKALDDAMQDLPMTPTQKSKAVEFCRVAARKEADTELQSGIVFAGFGRDEPFPVLLSFHLEALLVDWLRLKRAEACSINVTAADPSAAIFPFAQRDVVETLMNGIDPYFLETVLAAVFETLRQYPDVIHDVFKEDVEEERLREALDKITAFGARIPSEFRQRIIEFTKERYVDPILAAVDILPKDELAAMAEALVNLTSFKRKMSLDMETVGEPIDVAVISKGDGFVWIKRKHYFDPGNNREFLGG